MRVRFDVVITFNEKEEKAAMREHPKKYGWLLSKSRWIRNHGDTVITVLLFYGIISHLFKNVQLHSPR